MPGLVPELDVSDLGASRTFYEAVCGFRVAYSRPEERFACLRLGEVELMLQEADGPGRRFRTAPLEAPFGRGVNFQIEVADVDGIHERCAAKGVGIVLPIENRAYRTDRGEEMVRQFVLSDPDGYLMRFTETLEIRPLA